MAGFSTRWVFRVRQAVLSDDVDDDGVAREAALRRWVAAACDAYVEQCPRIRALLDEPGHVVQRDIAVPGRLRSDRTDLVVSARATEIWPRAFKIAVRIRTAADTELDAVLDASCVLSVRRADTGEDVELGSDVRDELIALEHTARHFN